jgi:hypothetical protein
MDPRARKNEGRVISEDVLVIDINFQINFEI